MQFLDAFGSVERHNWSLVYAERGCIWHGCCLSQPHFGQVWGWSPTLGKVGGLESSGTPECSELDSKAQNTLHWGVLGVIGKVLKRKYQKWPHIGHSNVCSPRYGQNKGREPTTKSRESTFTRHLLEECNTALESFRRELQLWLRTRPDQSSGRGAVAVQSPGTPTRDSFRTPFRESQQNVPFGCSLCDQPQRILYGGRRWLPPSPGRGVSRGPKCPWLVPTPKGVPELWTNHFVVCFDADSSLIN